MEAREWQCLCYLGRLVHGIQWFLGGKTSVFFVLDHLPGIVFMRMYMMLDLFEHNWFFAI